MKKTFLTLMAGAFMAGSVYAATPLWLRDVKISPDGSEIVFTYKGDIYKVPVTGGTATRLTSQPSYESEPVWSPDGKQIAFASDRNGGADVFIMSADGGPATRLTVNSANEYPEAFTPDGKYVIFNANIQDPAESALFAHKSQSELYKVPATGGRTTQMLATPAMFVSYLPDGESFLYEDVKGGEDQWRKHHTSSVTRDIWRYDAKTGKHTNLTLRGGEDRNPVVGTDGKTAYFLSERGKGSTFNVYSFPIDNPSQITQVTDFKTHPVRFLSQGADGTLAFAYDGEIYTKKGNAAPQKVKIDITRDDVDPIETVNVRAAGGGAVSPDGKQLAFTSRGEVFVTSTEHNSTKQITHTPARESDVTWSPDGKALYYSSERDGHYNIYKATLGHSSDPNFSNATIINETAIFPSDGIDRNYPSISPDGKKMSFVEDRNKLKVIDLATKKITQMTDGTTIANRTKGFSSQWSPDGKWILITATDLHHQPYSDIAIVNASTGKMTYITKTGYFDESPRWVLDGNAIMFASDRYGMRSHASWGSQYDIMLAFLNQDAYDKFRLNEEDYNLLKDMEKANKKNAEKKTETADKKGGKKGTEKAPEAKSESKDIVVELDGIKDRTVRITPNSAALADAIMTQDGETIYYLTSFEKGYDLWKINPRKREVKLVNKLGSGNMGMEMDKDGKIYLLGAQARQFDPKTEKMKNINVGTTLKLDPRKEREYMLRFVYNEEKQRFYDPNLHGVDWDGLYEAYARFLPHIDNNYDFQELLSELLGELNVSHTGGRYTPAPAQNPTASLGLFYDWNYEGPGLKITEVIENGPFDKAVSRVKAGNIIESINGVTLDAESDYTELLNNQAAQKTLVGLYDPATGSRWEEVVLPISAGAHNNLLYNRWVKNRAADVERMSDGRLGYVHIKGMNDESFRVIYAQILGEYVDKEGIVIDTRWNGGGRLHEDIEVMFSAKPYFVQDVHGVPTGVMPSRRWTKPSIMLTCEANYSNAHGTPWVYKYKELGKLVGMPVPGTMTSVNWVTMQDPSMVFGIPVTGYRLADGSYLENQQLEPDIKIANDPATVVKGEDTQLRVAVEELLKEIDSQKK